MSDLKRELQSIRAKREEDVAYLNQARANQVSSRWVQRSLDELRKQISELARAVNLSATITHKQNLDSNLKLARADFLTFRKEIEEMKAVQKRNVAAAGLTQQDLTELRGRMQKLLVTQAHLGQEMTYLKEDTFRRPMIEDELLLRKGNARGMKEETGIGGRQVRHHWKAEIIALKAKTMMMVELQLQLQKELKKVKEAYSSLNASVYRLDHTTRRISNQSTNLQSDHDVMLREMYEAKGRLEIVEEEAGRHERKLYNISHSVASIDKLHDSTMQLFRTMGSMEDKYDKSLTDLQKEISKLEYVATQVQSSYDTVRENQADLAGTITNVKKSLTALQYRTEGDHLQLVGFKTRLANASLNSCWDRGELLRMEVKVGALERTLNGIASKIGYEEETGVEGKTVTKEDKYPTGCSQITSSGTYIVRPTPDSPLKEILCYRDKGENSWTVIQKRTEGNVDFSRSWQDYSKGFGDVVGDYWVGNQFLHNLTSSAKCTLRIDMWDKEGIHRFASYDNFTVSSEKNNYALHLGQYHGTSGDGLKSHNGLDFSTRDRDNDYSSGNCALVHSGGWWYNRCEHSNLNGSFRKGIVWYNPESRKRIHLSRVEMMVRM